MYAEALVGWARIEKSSLVSSQTGSVTRTEVLYLNPRAAEQLALVTSASLR